MTNLNIKIEELISQNAADFEIAKIIKIDIKEYLSSLDELFNQSQGKDFFVKHTKKIDSFIQIISKVLSLKNLIVSDGNFAIQTDINHALPINT